MAENNFDIIIIGAGPGGYVTAIRAAQLGFKTAIVEDRHLGGICLNWGCIPTKALLRSAEIFDYFKRAKEYGLSADNLKFDATAVVERSRGVASRLSAGVQHLLKKNKVTIIDGRGKLAGAGKVDVSKDGKAVASLTGKHIILATGARPRVFPGLEADGKLVWSYFEALVPKEMPKSMLVIGSGAIGIEFASFYNSMGVDVTVVEVMNQIMPVEDAEISKFARKQLEKHGLSIMTEAKVAKL
ncbi:MAG TPA: FAD-binding protein, partial [Rhizobiales bacterium]|nr:FAD-binding protein [Hyphomicrobiales bacterium]